MLFINLEDSSAKIEVLVFPKIYKKNVLIWQPDNIVSIKGKINTKDGQLKIIAEDIKEISHQETITSETSKKFVINLPTNTKKEILNKIKNTLEKYKGDIQVNIILKQNGVSREIKTKSRVSYDLELIKDLNLILPTGIFQFQ